MIDMKVLINEEHKNHDRDSAADVFRCLLMFLIVLHHCAFHGHWALNTSIWGIPVLFSLAIFWCVDGFIAISGWYGIKFSLMKFLRLWGVIIFYSFVRFLIAIFLLDHPLTDSLKVMTGWFGSCYLAFMFLAPLINRAVQYIVKSDRVKAYLIWGVFNVGMFLCWKPLSVVSGVSWGCSEFSIQTFFLVYVNMRFIRALDLQRCVKLWHVWGIGGGYLLFVILFSVLPAMIKIASSGGGVSQLTWVGYTRYNSPHCVLMAIAMFLLFHNFLKIPKIVGAMAQKMAPLMFGVYIIHEATGIGRMIYKLPQQWAANSNVHPILIIFASALLTYFMCIALELLRVKFVKLLRMKIRPLQLTTVQNVLNANI